MGSNYYVRRLYVAPRLAISVLALCSTAMVCGPFGPPIVNCLGQPAQVFFLQTAGPSGPGTLSHGQATYEHHPPEPPSSVVLVLPSGAEHVVSEEQLALALDSGASVAVAPGGLELVPNRGRSCP